MAARHRRVDPLDEGEALLGTPGHLGGNGGKPLVHRGDELFPRRGAADGLGDALDVGVDVGHGMRPQGDDTRLAVHKFAHRALDVGQRHGAHLALILREDDVGLQFLQRVGVNLVNGEAVLDQRAHALVDLGARAVHIELRPRDRRQLENRRRVVAFVRAGDLQIAGTEGVQQLGGAGDE